MGDVKKRRKNVCKNNDNEKELKEYLLKKGFVIKELSVNLNNYGFLAKNTHCNC